MSIAPCSRATDAREVSRVAQDHKRLKAAWVSGTRSDAGQ